MPSSHKRIAEGGDLGGSKVRSAGKSVSHFVNTPTPLQTQARLLIRRTNDIGRRDVYLYSVEFDGELIVTGSNDPVARALQARGVTGFVTLIDGETGKPRTIVNIEKAARLALREDRSIGPRFVKWRHMPRKARQRCEGPPSSRESVSLGERYRPAHGRALP